MYGFKNDCHVDSFNGGTYGSFVAIRGESTDDGAVADVCVDLDLEEEERVVGFRPEFRRPARSAPLGAPAALSE